MIDETFQQAAQSFGDFLVSMGWSRNVVWFFRDAITQHRRSLLFDLNALHSLALVDHVEALYEEGRQQGLGVKFYALAHVSGVTLAYIWVPEDAAAADAAMMTGRLRFSVSSGPMVVSLTQRRWWFRLVRWVDTLRGGGTFVNDVPGRPSAP